MHLHLYFKRKFVNDGREVNRDWRKYSANEISEMYHEALIEAVSILDIIRNGQPIGQIESNANKDSLQSVKMGEKKVIGENNVTKSVLEAK